MTANDIQEALDIVCAHCDELMDGYIGISLRRSLKFNGYNRVQQDEIIRFCAMNGFDYCIDPIIPSRTDPSKPTPAFACEWGPDQLKSRIQCVRIPRFVESGLPDSKGES